MLAVLAEFPFLRGMLMGLLMAAPIGAVGVMCAKRALSGQWARALAVGLGSASVDALFGTAAGLGLTLVAAFVTEHRTVLGLIGGVIVTGMGVATYLAPVRTEIAKLESAQVGRDFATAFMLSAANPATFLGALGLFAATGGADPEITRRAALLLVAGVFAGSMLWWTLLATLARLLCRRFSAATLQRLNKIEGAVIAALGVAAIAAAGLARLGG